MFAKKLISRKIEILPNFLYALCRLCLHACAVLYVKQFAKSFIVKISQIVFFFFE